MFTTFSYRIKLALTYFLLLAVDKVGVVGREPDEQFYDEPFDPYHYRGSCHSDNRGYTSRTNRYNARPFSPGQGTYGRSRPRTRA